MMPITETTPKDPFALFAEWFAAAKEKEPNEPNAMVLATVDPEGMPSMRMVLLKGFDESGFVFYSNLESRKGVQLQGNPKAALQFHWKSLRRQVRIEGIASPVGGEEADAYFASRPRQSRIGAWASDQSRPMAGRFELEKRVARFAAKYGLGEIPRPPQQNGTATSVSASCVPSRNRDPPPTSGPKFDPPPLSLPSTPSKPSSIRLHGPSTSALK